MIQNSWAQTCRQTQFIKPFETDRFALEFSPCSSTRCAHRVHHKVLETGLSAWEATSVHEEIKIGNTSRCRCTTLHVPLGEQKNENAQREGSCWAWTSGSIGQALHVQADLLLPINQPVFSSNRLHVFAFLHRSSQACKLRSSLWRRLLCSQAWDSEPLKGQGSRCHSKTKDFDCE